MRTNGRRCLANIVIQHLSVSDTIETVCSYTWHTKMKTLPLAVVTHRHKPLRSLASLATSLLFLAATTWPPATGFGSFEGPIFKPFASHTTGSRLSSKFMVATEQTVETDPFPELGKGGVYHITTPEQHQYVTLCLRWSRFAFLTVSRSC